MASSPGDASAGTPSPRRHVIVTPRATAEHRGLDAVRTGSLKMATRRVDGMKRTPRARQRHRALALRVVLLEEIIYNKLKFIDVFHLLIYTGVGVRIQKIAVEQALRTYV